MTITGKTIDSGVDVKLRSKMRRFRKNKYYKLAHGTRTSHGTRGRRVEIDADGRAADEPLQAVVMAVEGASTGRACFEMTGDRRRGRQRANPYGDPQSDDSKKILRFMKRQDIMHAIHDNNGITTHGTWHMLDAGHAGRNPPPPAKLSRGTGNGFRPGGDQRGEGRQGLVVAGSHIHMMNWPSGIKLMPGLLHEMQQKAAIGLEKGESGHGRIIPCPQTDCGYGRQDEATTLCLALTAACRNSHVERRKASCGITKAKYKVNRVNARLGEELSPALSVGRAVATSVVLCISMPTLISDEMEGAYTGILNASAPGCRVQDDLLYLLLYSVPEDALAGMALHSLWDTEVPRTAFYSLPSVKLLPYAACHIERALSRRKVVRIILAIGTMPVTICVLTPAVAALAPPCHYCATGMHTWPCQVEGTILVARALD
ncbi:hypothetical protein X797_009176 [Metarhizium robertsii]|uniref:Uncharacterized protein n=1 Tax=Metarhizium robertsii TaxID=568076 RepID=A0A0A1UQ68_9HYPO|nr:hypothetical protein X797_009176 [Metarhizium robertsii]